MWTLTRLPCRGGGRRAGLRQFSNQPIDPSDGCIQIQHMERGGFGVAELRHHVFGDAMRQLEINASAASARVCSPSCMHRTYRLVWNPWKPRRSTASQFGSRGHLRCPPIRAPLRSALQKTLSFPFWPSDHDRPAAAHNPWALRGLTARKLSPPLRSSETFRPRGCTPRP